ncbi:MAG: hypothetical protein M3124_02390 [Actinomycetota bacterium]|nr:hypothetical protein [Actinomycetota bacterium]
MPAARGGVSLGAILTGVVVAVGAMFLLSALVGGVLVATGTSLEEVATTEAVNAGIATGIALVVAQFLAYLWGGYTAGRMGRGAGFANGLLVPLLALLIALAVGAIASALGATAQLNVPWDTTRLPVEENSIVDFGPGIGIAGLVAMFVGGIVGGMLGSRWHTKLERREVEERAAGEGRGARAEEEGARAVEERRRLAQRAETRRGTAAPVSPATGRATATDEPVVRNHGTSTGANPTSPQRTPRAAPPPADAQTTSEKPSLKDRLTGQS